MSEIDTDTWREALAALRRPKVAAVLTVQCDLGWLRPAAAALRDEIDESLAAFAMERGHIRIDRVILHSLPAIGDVPPAEIAALNAAHADWLYRLALVGVLLPKTARLRVHRVIVAGGQRSVEAVDGMGVLVNGEWSDPDVAEAALPILRRAGATTPLTAYDIDLNGPFGDANPSVYL